MSTETDAKAANHLVLFLHGHAGHPSDLTYISNEVNKRHSDRVITYSMTSYKDQTNNGIDHTGNLAVSEIQEHISRLQEEGTIVEHISFVGHSFGGLVSRYAIGSLYASKFFERVKPMTFATFATPHLGVRKLAAGSAIDTFMDNSFNALAPIFTGKSGSQLFLQDNHDGRPLLVAMAEEDSDYFQALQLFPHKTLYANVAKDYLVPYFTASISDLDFDDSYPAVTGYEPVLYDICGSVPIASGLTPGSGTKLRLCDHQRSIIKSLNALPWAKFAVRIRGYWSTHTAILVFKIGREETCEGRVVVRHFVDHLLTDS